ncbi:MAG: SCO family protein, partial [Bryobacteraceae bacterium]
MRRLAFFLIAHAALAQNILRPNDVGLPAGVTPPGLQGVGIDPKLDGALPLDLAFRDEAGRAVKLGEYFAGRPVLLVPVYYECPMLCTEILRGVVGSLRA